MNYTRFSAQSVAWFRSRNTDGALDKRPPFQRYFVWSKRQQSALIETILLDYPIPELYMQEGLSPDGVERYIVVDGQQRITTVLSYLSNSFAMDSTAALYPKMKFRNLPDEAKSKILQYQFIVRTLPSDWGEERLRDVFSRLNRGVSALTDQELRHATYWGPFISTMEKLAEDPRWGALRLFTSNDVRRMLDVEYISELAVAHLHGHQNKKESLDDFYLLYEEGFDQGEEIEYIFDRTLRVVEDLLDEGLGKRWRKKSDFYTLFLLLASDATKWGKYSRSRLVELLNRFAHDVDDALSRLGQNVAAVQTGDTATADAFAGFDANVSRYVLAVRGAASDLTARRARHDALAAWLASSEVSDTSMFDVITVQVTPEAAPPNAARRSQKAKGGTVNKKTAPSDGGSKQPANESPSAPSRRRVTKSDPPGRRAKK